MRHARRLHREWSRKRDPKSPFETEQHELLVSLGISPKAAREIIAYLDGDLFNLWGRDPDDLMAIDGVGEVTVARLVAVLVLAAQFSERVVGRAA